MTHELRILGRPGDIKVSWNSEHDIEISAAREIFEKHTKGGWSAFRESKIGLKGDKIKIFDPDAERIVLVPPMSGG